MNVSVHFSSFFFLLVLALERYDTELICFECFDIGVKMKKKEGILRYKFNLNFDQACRPEPVRCSEL